ncbi:MAG TPA: septum site-determining protein MinC [Clostridia bacterium]|nr:septum site-determining protein MinC [Clostridia bacterium]
MDSCNVTFKATVNGLIILMHEEDDFESIYSQIEKKVASAGRFFRDASISIKYRGKKLSKEQEDRIMNLMLSKTGAEIKGIKEDLEEDVKPVARKSEPVDKITMKKFFFKGINEGITKFYRGTVRSGQLISFDGNLVVVGDVNPGGEVIATGNVMVMGSLRGMVHAGADGNKEALVVAFNLQPTQLRIADVITRAPDEKSSISPFIPELAFVKDDTVYIERYLPQR